MKLLSRQSTGQIALTAKSLTRRTLLVLGFIALSSVFSAQATIDMFINFGATIKGESLDKVQGPKGDCDVLAWSWGMSHSGTTHAGDGGGGGTANFHDISLTKWVDSASTGLMTALAKNSHLAQVVLLIRRTGSEPTNYIEMTLEDVIVTSLSTGGSAGEDRLSENVTLNFAKVKFDYYQLDQAGVVGAAKTFGWNIPDNTIASKPVEVQAGPVTPPTKAVLTPSDASLRKFVRAGTADKLQAHEEVRAGKRYLAVEVTRPKNTAGAAIAAQTSSDAQTWSSDTVIEEVTQDSVDTQTTRYVIPIDQAQKFFRTATE